MDRNGRLYLELLKKVLTNVIYQDASHAIHQIYRERDDREDYDPNAT